MIEKFDIEYQGALYKAVELRAPSDGGKGCDAYVFAEEALWNAIADPATGEPKDADGERIWESVEYFTRSAHLARTPGEFLSLLREEYPDARDFAGPGKMKVYISLPITGRDPDEAEASALFAEGVLESKGHEPVNPLRIGEETDSYGTLMGKDIASIIDCCDAVVMLDGWERSRGCRAEKAVAEVYGKRTYLSLDDVPPNADALLAS